MILSLFNNFINYYMYIYIYLFILIMLFVLIFSLSYMYLILYFIKRKLYERTHQDKIFIFSMDKFLMHMFIYYYYYPSIFFHRSKDLWLPGFDRRFNRQNEEGS